MAFNWLFGPRRVDVIPGTVELRSLVVGADLVHELASVMKAELGNVRLRKVMSIEVATTVPGIEGEQLSVTEDLSKAPEWELRRLVLIGWKNGFEGWPLAVHLNRTRPTTVAFREGVEAPPELANLAYKLVERLDNEGRPRVRWRAATPRLPWVVFAALVLAWVWVLASDTPSTGLAVFGSLLVVAAAPSAGFAVGWAHQRVVARASNLIVGRAERPLEPGTRIRTISRHELRARRATVRLALGTAVVSALLGVGGTLLVQAMR